MQAVIDGELKNLPQSLEHSVGRFWPVEHCVAAIHKMLRLKGGERFVAVILVFAEAIEN